MHWGRDPRMCDPSDKKPIDIDWMAHVNHYMYMYMYIRFCNKHLEQIHCVTECSIHCPADSADEEYMYADAYH